MKARVISINTRFLVRTSPPQKINAFLALTVLQEVIGIAGGVGGCKMYLPLGRDIIKPSLGSASSPFLSFSYHDMMPGATTKNNRFLTSAPIPQLH